MLIYDLTVDALLNSIDRIYSQVYLRLPEYKYITIDRAHSLIK